MKLCTLRQGTVLIAVVDMMLSGFLLFILILGSSHAQDMSELLEADIVDHDQRDETEAGHQNNENRLHTAQRLASATLITLYTVICIVTVHLISSISLLCGAILRIHQFLVPWASILLVELILCTTLLLSFIWVGQGSRLGYVSAAIVLQIYLCFWCLVWNYYQILTSQSCGQRIVTESIITEFKAGYISFPSDKPQSV